MSKNENPTYLHIKPTPDGGRVIKGDTPWGKYCFVMGLNDKLVSHEYEKRDPLEGQPPPPKKEGCCKKLTLAEKAHGAWKLNKAVDGYCDVSDEVLERRKAICNACPRNDIGRCQVCGCFLYGKIRSAVEDCPDDKWEKFE